ncbi:hypothetical protein KR044_011189 [Drosophila immigrans]|nr:hypothetical protein KR044_011189 [Drosophila immigrans]
MLKNVCCMRLHTAGVVVGYLGLAGSILVTVVAGCAIGFADAIVDHLQQSGKADPSAHEQMHMAVVIVGCIYLGSAIISTMASGMLVLGTIKVRQTRYQFGFFNYLLLIDSNYYMVTQNRHLMMLPWMVLHGLGLISQAIYNLVLFYALIRAPLDVAFLFIMSALYLALYAYIYAGIYSLYKHIQMSNDEQRPLVRPEGTHDSTTYPNYTKI